MASICNKLGKSGKEVMLLWLRYATSSDPAASFARQLDKYQAVEKALEYEKSQGIPLFREFADYERKLKRINHPILLKKLKELEFEWEAFKRDSN